MKSTKLFEADWSSRAIIWFAPALLACVWFVPTVIVVVASFVQLDPSEPAQINTFNGFGNYYNVLGSNAFWLAIGRTLKLTAVVVVASGLIAAVVGWALAGIEARVARMAVTAIIVPLFLPPITSALMWHFQFNPNYGPLGYCFQVSAGQSILHPSTAFTAISIAECWRLAPLFILIIFVCNRSLQPSLRETLAIYGPRMPIARYILLWRQYKNPLSIALFLGIASVARSFESIFVATGGGPGDLTETLPMLIHRTAFQRFQLGIAASQSVLYDILLVVVLGLMWRRFGVSND